MQFNDLYLLDVENKDWADLDMPWNVPRCWMKPYDVAMKLLTVSFLAKGKEHKMKVIQPVVRSQEVRQAAVAEVPKASHKYLNLGPLPAW